MKDESKLPASSIYSLVALGGTILTNYNRAWRKQSPSGDLIFRYFFPFKVCLVTASGAKDSSLLLKT